MVNSAGQFVPGRIGVDEGASALLAETLRIGSATAWASRWHVARDRSSGQSWGSLSSPGASPRASRQVSDGIKQSPSEQSSFQLPFVQSRRLAARPAV